MSRTSIAESLYEKLVDDEDARACATIGEDACREVPGNFLLTILSTFLSKLGDAIANPKIVLPWVMEAIGSPLYLLGWLVPIRESGSLIPQLAIADLVRRLEIRKWAWVLGSLLQAICVAGMGLVAWTLHGALAGWSIIGLLVIFSLARGLCSVAFKDVMGKTIPKKRRGRVNGWSGSLAGLVTIAIAASMLLVAEQSFSTTVYAFGLGAAGVLWCVAGLVYARIREFSGQTSGGRKGLSLALERLDLLRTDAPFRLFVLTRALFLCSALTAPYYVVLAQRHLESTAGMLGMFMLASGAASLISGPLWGRFADVSSRRVMALGAGIAAMLGALIFALAQWRPDWMTIFWLLPGCYFVLSIAHEGVRIGRKTYLVDMAEGDRRTDYVAVSNTVIGVILLFAGLSGTLTTWLGIPSIILAFSALGMLGVILAHWLPEVQQDA